MSSRCSDYKVNNRFFNYGLIKKGTKRYRRALRQAKKTQKKYWIKKGFDYSELWNIDHTFYSFLLAHNYIPKEYIPFFKIIKEEVYWEESVGELYNLTEIKTIRDKYDEIIQAEISYINKLPINDRMAITLFLIPRIKEFKEYKNGHPVQYTETDWDKILDDIIKDIDKMIYESLFEHIHQMWD